MLLPNITIDQNQRIDALYQWVSSHFPSTSITIAPLAGDASFRRYFRATVGDQSFVVMDAPPHRENVLPFIAIAKAFQNTVVRLPYIFSADVANGFLLLSDFGDQSLLTLLDVASAETLYPSVMRVLLTLQKRDSIPHYVLPTFDDALFWKEFDIFFTWYLRKHLNKTISVADETQLKNVYQKIILSAHEQPTVFVHRDYHSRNLMLCSDGEIGVLDFQDAVCGPITYDLVSLLRDCYIAWPEKEIEKWAFSFYEQLLCDHHAWVFDFNTFLRWFDWMGLQRHLKCLGIFSRLFYRDQKENYLKEIPRVLHYVTMICDRYPELSVLKNFCEK